MIQVNNNNNNNNNNDSNDDNDNDNYDNNNNGNNNDDNDNNNNNNNNDSNCYFDDLHNVTIMITVIIKQAYCKRYCNSFTITCCSHSRLSYPFR